MPFLPRLIPAFLRRRFRRRPKPDSYEATLAATDARIRRLVARITIDLPRSERQARTAATRAVLFVWAVVATLVYLAARSTTAHPHEVHGERRLWPWSLTGHEASTVAILAHAAWTWTATSAAVHPRFVAAGLFALGPILLCTTRALVTSALDVQRRRAIDALAVQRAALRATLEELKDMTAFYRASALLDRYAHLFATDKDDKPTAHVSAPASPTRARRATPGPSAPASIPAPTESSSTAAAVVPGPGPARGRAHSTPARAWVQQLVDRVVMGGGAGGETKLDPTRHYALVCHACFRHNGLVTLATRVRAGFKCRHCGEVTEAPRTGGLMVPALKRGVDGVEEKGRVERVEKDEGTRALSPTRGGRARAKSAAR
ncbi:hypothetical protein GGF32_004011 [Allomyces javanicus]|nr:hypothetical protein GGF32_004011 [Allomyces javanicus]